MGWFSSRRVVTILSALGLLLFLGRALADVRWEISKQDPSGAGMPGAYAGYLLVTALWIWGLLGIAAKQRAQLIALMVLNFLLLIVMGVLTAVVFCPPGCEAFPLGWFWNWTGFAGGILALVSEVLYLRSGTA